jgi:excinuclease ABC subunit B
LDLPEVRLVAVMDADKEGFLRSRSSLIQVVGRAARNVDGRVIFYADRMTASMQACIDETERRRTIQIAYNTEHGIEPKSIIKALPVDLRKLYGLDTEEESAAATGTQVDLKELGVNSVAELEALIKKKQKDMKKYAADLEFERAADLRDEVSKLREAMLALAGDSDALAGSGTADGKG